MRDLIIKTEVVKAEEINEKLCLKLDNSNLFYEDAIFFDLEHYVYKVPICIGVFGCCYYDKNTNSLLVTQYMIESRKDANNIVFMIEKYFNDCIENKGKKYIVTFSGNNDFTMLKYLFNKKKIKFDIDSRFIHIDLQVQYEKVKKICIGLKNLEKLFNIEREGELISGSNLAKTFCKIIYDKEYYDRMPVEKKEKILKYNEQDVVNLFYILTNWNEYVLI